MWRNAESGDELKAINSAARGLRKEDFSDIDRNRDDEADEDVRARWRLVDEARRPWHEIVLFMMLISSE